MSSVITSKNFITTIIVTLALVIGIAMICLAWTY